MVLSEKTICSVFLEGKCLILGWACGDGRRCGPIAGGMVGKEMDHINKRMAGFHQ